MGNIVIKDTDNNKEYKLEYNRHALIVMEEKGFDITEYEKKPLKSISLLINGAFIKNHPNIDENEIDSIISKISDKNNFINALAQLYGDAVNSIVVNNDNSSKNITWDKK